MSRPPVEIIAEIAGAHQGDPALALELAHAAFEAGADAVKFQVYQPEEMLVRAHSRFEHFKQRAFTQEVWRELLTRLIRGGRGRVYCDVFGLQSQTLAQELSVHGVKAHASDLGNVHLLDTLAKTPQKIFLGLGGCTLPEIAEAVQRLTGSQSKHRPVLLHGFQGYPTAVEDCNLDRIRYLAELFGDRCEIGCEDHVDAENPLALSVPLAAVGMGATVLEKHITLNRSQKGIDYYSSLNPDEFAHWVGQVRSIEQAIGVSPVTFSGAEKNYRKAVKKHWVTNRSMQAGENLTPEDLVMKRVEAVSAEPLELNLLAGKKLKRDIPEEHPVNRLDLEETVWALVAARMASERLPGKAMLDVAGMPAIEHLLRRLQRAKGLDRIVLCTTEAAEDAVLAQTAKAVGVRCYRGPTQDVLGRMIGALGREPVDAILRITGDDILIDPEYVDHAVKHHLTSGAEYSDLKAVPKGADFEVLDVRLLRYIHAAARDLSVSEYLTSYLTAHLEQFRSSHIPLIDPGHARSWRLTMDTREDYGVIRSFLVDMKKQGKGLTYRMDDLVSFFQNHEELLQKNAHIMQRSVPAEVCVELDWRRWA